MPLDIAPFQARRSRLLATMQAAGGGVAIIPTAPERVRNRDTHHSYRFDSYFYYLTGFREPEAVLVLVAGDAPRSLLFCRNKDIEREIWDGYRHGPDAARETFGFDEAHPIAELDAKLAELLLNQPTIFYSMGYEPDWDRRLTDALNRVRAQARSGHQAPAQIRDVRSLVDEMRLVKDDSEIATMRRAAAITAGAHRRAMLTARHGAWEHELEAELLHEFRRHGSQSPAYGSIVASGPNACVLHYVENDRQLADGDLLLHRENGMIAEGLLNYLALLGWSISPDEDIFSMEEMVAAFDVADVNPNPARFDQKKCTAINATHIRMLSEDDFAARVVPFLHSQSLVSADRFEDLLPREREILTKAAPLVQTRVQVLSEAVGMLGFLFTLDEQIVVEDDARKQLKGDTEAVLAAAVAALEVIPTEEFTAERIHDALNVALIEGLELKPRFAFTPPRVALTGRRVSPPLFESMEILGKDASLTRLKNFK